MPFFFAPTQPPPPVANVSTPKQASIGRNLQRPSIKPQDAPEAKKTQQSTANNAKPAAYEVGNSQKDRYALGSWVCLHHLYVFVKSSYQVVFLTDYLSRFLMLAIPIFCSKVSTEFMLSDN